MSSEPIHEAAGKRMLNNNLPQNVVTQCQSVTVDETTNLDQLPACNPWLLNTPLVVRPDRLIKRYGQLGLTKVNADFNTCKQWIRERMGKDTKVGAATGELKHFVIEPFIPHQQSDEACVCIHSHRNGTSQWISEIAANRHNVSVILGSQWGDEGKGKIVDLLSASAEIVCRFQGGNNAGHTVVVDDKSFDFHLLPCGILNRDCISVIGNGVVVNLPQLFDELERNYNLSITINDSSGHETKADWMNRLYISNEAHLVLDVHQKADGLLEADLQSDGERQIGTTKKGIGPTYSTKALRMGIRMDELIDNFELFEKELRHLIKYHERQFEDRAHLLDVDKELEKYRDLAERIRPCVKDTRKFLNDSIKKGKKILIEGANGSMLDIDHGTYPYVTSSNCTIGGVCTGLGLPTTAIGSIYGVVKAYCTRVGDGPFPTELHDDTGALLQALGHEVGVTTKRKRRCGWLDCVLLSYTNMLNDYTALALTKLDVLSTLDEIKVAKAYILDGVTIDTPPLNANRLSRVEVVYETLKGWKTDISGVRNFKDLPQEARDYVAYIERHVNVPIKWIGVGQERDAIINVF